MPSFNIEAPGEANPLTHLEVYRTLEKASRSEQQIVRTATEQLNNWQTQPGYYSLVQNVYADLSVDQNIRFQAIIQLKNGIEKHWRKTSTHPIGKQEKEKIRSTSLNFGIVEPAHPLALQNALMLAKIIRNEFPHEWPDAIAKIISHLRSVPQRANILLMTLQVIKELAAGKLQRTRKNLEQVSGEMLDVLKMIYLGEMGRNKELALKSIRRLLVAGFEHPHRDSGVEQMWQVLNQQCDNQPQLSKLHLQMARAHPASFALLPGMVSLVGHAWTIVSSGTDEKSALRALLLFRACVKMVFHPSHTFKYQHPKDKEDRKLSVDLVKSQVLQNDLVVQLIEVLVIKYFPLNEIDLQEWQNDPDEFAQKDDEVSDSWEFSVRPCAEKLFLDLAVNYKSLVVPKLQEIVKMGRDDIDIFRKESIYSAIGIAAPVLEDAVDMNDLLPTLITELRSQQQFVVILRRRIAILLAQWVPVKPDSLDRRHVFEAFTFLLSAEATNDEVVRITAGRQMRHVLEAFDSVEVYVSLILGNLMELILVVENIESKLALLDTLRIAILKVDEAAEPFAANIMLLLGRSWTENPEEYLLHQRILTVITALVAALKSQSVTFNPTIIPLIRNAVSSEAQSYLLEEALDLWSTILLYETVALFDDLLPLLAMGSDSLEQVFELCQEYIDRAPVVVLKSAKQVLTALTPFLEVLGSRRAREALMVPRLVEKMLISLSTLETDLRVDAFDHVVQSLVESGFLTKMMELLKEAYSHHSDPRHPAQITGPAENALFNIVARLCLTNAQATIQILEEWTVKEWITIIDTIGDVSQKKTQVLGLTNLFPYLPREFLQDMMTIWTDAMLEMEESDLRQIIKRTMDEVSRREDFNGALNQVDEDVLKAFKEAAS